MKSSVVVLVALVSYSYAKFSQQRPAAILRLSSDISPDGSFQYAYQTEDGISADARGTVTNTRSADGPATSVTGKYSYTGPDGQQYTVTYVADENGFQPQGAHLPVPPPIPAAIQRSLDFIARSGSSQGQTTFQTQQPFIQPQQQQAFRAGQTSFGSGQTTFGSGQSAFGGFPSF